MSFTIRKQFTVKNSVRVQPATIVGNTDIYWNNVSMLLKGDGSDGGNNNTMVDSSTNNFTLTKNGNPVQGLVAPFTGSGGSIYFNGSTDYISMQYNASIHDFGSGDFTIEYYVNHSVIKNYSGLVGPVIGESSFSINTFTYADGSMGVTLIGSGVQILTSAGVFVVNRFQHVALVRSSGTTTLYVDGVSKGTFVSSDSMRFCGSSGSHIGSTHGTGYFNGYISNVRVVKGTAVYTSNFTPSTTPLTAISGTSLLIKGENGQIVDSARKSNLLTVGDTKISTTTKKYDAGSIVFNGSTDYLSVIDNEMFNFGSSNFTLESFVYMTSSNSQQTIVCQWDGVGGGTGLSWTMLTSNDSNRYLRGMVSSNGSGVAFDLVSSTAIPLNQWAHCAFVRNGNVFTLYLDGTSVASTTASVTLFNTTNTVTVGSTSTGTQKFSGYIDDLRITKGIARYTENFTPPTSAPTS